MEKKKITKVADISLSSSRKEILLFPRRCDEILRFIDHLRYILLAENQSPDFLSRINQAAAGRRAGRTFSSNSNALRACRGEACSLSLSRSLSLLAVERSTKRVITVETRSRERERAREKEEKGKYARRRTVTRRYS